MLDFWRLHGLVTNIESVYYIHFGDLDSADSVAEIDLSLLSLDELISHVLSLDHLTYLHLPLSALVPKAR